MARPVLLVLAGVNGAGKSSIGGHLLKQHGLTWFNPDHFAREIREARIRERYPQAMLNLIALMPDLAHLQVYDNSAEAAPGTSIADPVLVLEMERGRLIWPRPEDLDALRHTPEWAKPLVEAALTSDPAGDGT